MRQAREIKYRLARGRDSGTLLSRRENLTGVFAANLKVGESATMKTLAAARSGEMKKVKDELRAMLPILKPSEVRRLLFLTVKNVLYLLRVLYYTLFRGASLRRLCQCYLHFAQITLNKRAIKVVLFISSNRYRLPPHEAIIDELEESNYVESVCYLRELFELDEATRRAAGPETLTWEKPRLKDNRDAMLRLKKSLIAVERAKNAGGGEIISRSVSNFRYWNILIMYSIIIEMSRFVYLLSMSKSRNITKFLEVGDYVSTAAEFLNTALLFQAMTWEWWWVAERLYRSALENAKLVKDDDQRTSTITHYLYGRFLFEQKNYVRTMQSVQDTTESLYHLKLAREVCQEKSWNASKMTGRKEETIFRECNVLLYKILLMHAQQVRPDQPDVAVKACTEALARATDCELLIFVSQPNTVVSLNYITKSCAISSVIFTSAAGHYEYIANVLYELGMSQLRSGDVKLAFRNFSKFLAMVKRISDPEGICNAHMAMALAYKLCVTYVFPRFRFMYILPHMQTRLLRDLEKILRAILTADTYMQELDDDANTEKHLRLFVVNATKSGLTKKLAQAHYCTGEHFLSKKKPDIATFHLEKSFELYNEVGLNVDADKARALAGVSKGGLHVSSNYNVR
ncbi:PREDICTED: uncharacterized protein LOC105569786 [Vollenhovia emeryi]|uniref:uncharacterized protein LOC105569786 n=1 Tax=Vollenhovia emeryi TaxID=411798 RepID=UPI0005F54CA6|nr:PREDICTED: uncharacterized protein LOC105569786 [Vollenhovia emeryi]